MSKPNDLVQGTLDVLVLTMLAINTRTGPRYLLATASKQLLSGG